MSEILLSVACVLVSYLLGTIPSGYIVARVRGVNIQQVGSGNIGATNVLRSVGVIPAVFVAIADPLKGVAAVLLPKLLGLPPLVIALCGFVVVLGNDYNAFLKFRGGKGIAASLGVMLALNPLVGLLSAAIGIYTMLLGRLVSLGSLVGIAVAPLLLLMRPGMEVEYIAMTFALAALATWRHRENLVRLAQGTENRLGRSKSGEFKDASQVKPPR